MKYEQSQLKKLQAIETEILSEVIRVCKKLDITYFTVGGTTLGAIRHNGFIPWDDDIDIGMMRDDYERFIRTAPEELSKGYTLTHFLYDSNTPTYFAKVRKDGTRFVEEYTKNIPIHQGIFIDILPYDFVPTDERTRKKYNRKVAFWSQLYIAKTVDTLSFHSNKNIVLLKLIRKCLHFLMLPVSKRFLYRKTDEVLRSYDSLGESTKICSRGLDVFLNDVSDVFPPVEHKFEGINVMIPAKAERVLSQQYGDYMQLPPRSERYTHAPIILEFINCRENEY